MRLLVANEGQYGNPTASLSAVSVDNTIYNNVFSAVNNRPLGDVAQSIAVINNKIYVTLSNSHKLEAMDDHFRSVETMICPDGSVPGYITYLGGDSIAVSDKNFNGAGKLMILDINHAGKREIVRRTIESGSANQMLCLNGKLFLTGNTLRVFTLGDMKSGSMRIIKNSRGEDMSVAGDSKLVEDANGNIWMLNKDNLYCIDPSAEKVIRELPVQTITIGEWDGRLDISPDKKTLYFTASSGKRIGIAKMPVDAEVAPENLAVDLTDRIKVLYNMVVSPEGNILVCDVEFSNLTRSNIHEFTPDGNKIRTFRAGIMPQYIHFLK